MTVRKVQFESMDEVNRFLDVTEHFPFAVDLKRGSRTVNGKSILGVASIGLGREMDFCAHVPELAPEDNGYYRSSCSFQGLVPGTYMLERDGQLAATVTVTAEEPEYMVVLGGEK